MKKYIAKVVYQPNARILAPKSTPERQTTRNELAQIMQEFASDNSLANALNDLGKGWKLIDPKEHLIEELDILAFPHDCFTDTLRTLKVIHKNLNFGLVNIVTNKINNWGYGFTYREEYFSCTLFAENGRYTLIKESFLLDHSVTIKMKNR